MLGSIAYYSDHLDTSIQEFNGGNVRVFGTNFSEFQLSGFCDRLIFEHITNYTNIDLRGFVNLRIGEVFVGARDCGLLRILELNCTKIYQFSLDDKLVEIMHKYMSEPDPLMRDFEGFKLEMAVNGYGDRL